MITSIQIDCDPLWVYSSEYGLEPDYSDGTIYGHSLPALLDALQSRGLRATWFIIGRDLALPACVKFCRRALDAGHELASHTFSHLKDLHSAPPETVRDEIRRCHATIHDALGYECRGIRFPGYYFDRSVVPVCCPALGFI